jgi:predicted GNAT family acetyltransferase
MTWTLTDDLDAYAAAAGEILAREPERNTVMLSVLASLIKLGSRAFGDDSLVLGWWDGTGGDRAAVLRTPPHPMLITGLSGAAASELAQVLATAADQAGLTKVIGAEPGAGAFAVAWTALTGAESEVTQRQRLYRLGTLTPPDPVPDGTARVAGEADFPLVRDWEEAFAAENNQAGAASDVTKDKLLTGQIVLWEQAGEPRAMASVTPVISGVARVGQVYTPPARRRRGYGGAVTVAATELAQQRGAASVVLFTDLANPTSNTLYQRLGYQPVEDRVLIGFRQA